MLVRDVMNKQVVATKSETSLREASQMMTKINIGSLVVMENDKIVGILTGSDILKAISAGNDPNSTLVENVMSKDVKTVDPSQSIEEAVNYMLENKIKKLPVVDGEKVIGIITTSDIITIEPKLIAGVAKLISMRLSGYSGG